MKTAREIVAWEYSEPMSVDQFRAVQDAARAAGASIDMMGVVLTPCECCGENMLVDMQIGAPPDDRVFEVCLGCWVVREEFAIWGAG